MNLCKFVPVLLLLANVVRSGVISREDSKSSKRISSDVNEHNHPPLAEQYSVPVAVVYEERNREDKSIDVNVSSPKDIKSVDNIDSKELEKISPSTAEPTEDTTDLIENDMTDSSTTHATEPHDSIKSQSDDIIITNFEPDNNERRDTIRIFNPQDGLIIPVAVVYDVQPPNLQSERKLEKTKKGKSLGRQQRNRVTVTETTEDTNPADEKKNVKQILSNVNHANKQEVSQNENQEEKKITKINPKSRKEEKSINANKEVVLTDKTSSIQTFPKRTQERDPIVPIIQSESYVFSHSGDFHYSYEGGDGTKAFERGHLRSLDDAFGEAVEGSFSYKGKDGNDYSLTYTADENGYRPIGAHLPTPPPIPPAIARALKYLATKPTPATATESYDRT